MPNERQWLQAEQSGQDELAERIFARIVAELPPIEPSTDFVNRTVQRAWQARTRRLQVRRVALVAAAVLITVAVLGSIYESTALAMGLVVRSTVVFSHALVWLLTSTSEAAGWWWIAERIGAAVRDTIAAPSAAACVAAAEMIGLLAIYAFQRLLVADLEPHKVR